MQKQEQVQKWEAEAIAPSNIALIKYMGKKRGSFNEPLNSSLSLTIEHLFSVVQLKVFPSSFHVKGGGKIRPVGVQSDKSFDVWKPLKFLEALGEEGRKRMLDSQRQVPSLKLSISEKKRFLDHLKFLKRKFRLNGSFLVKSYNNFPISSGLASSASSFAALTLCAEKVMKKISVIRKRSENKSFGRYSLKSLSEMSQRASGSSLRSFFSPWCLWKKKRGGKALHDLPSLKHMVVIVKREKKMTLSSEAHEKVFSSTLFHKRPERAEKRLRDLIRFLREKEWLKVYQVVWAEFWDMHALFETSSEPFGYFSENSLKVLNYVRKAWEESKNGPIVTMDAGPNVHLFFRKDQRSMAKRMYSYFKKNFQVISSPDLI